jgi:hypothetical protein
VLGYVRDHHLAVLALFLSVGGGTGYAAVSAATPSAKTLYVCAATGKPLTLRSANIQVFMRFSGDVHPLPYTSYAGGKVSTLDFAVNVGKLQIRRFAHDNTGSIPLSSALQFRYVIITRGTVGASGT